MFKQLVLATVIFVFSISIAVAGCVLPKDTAVMLFTQGGMSPTAPTTDRPVMETSKQPTAETLKQFSDGAGQDWTDAVVVFDADFVIYVLVHKKDLVGECEVIEVE